MNVTFTTTCCNATFVCWYDAIERCVWLSVSVGRQGPLLWCTDDEATERRLRNAEQYELLGRGDGVAHGVHHRNVGRFNELLGHCVEERLEFVRVSSICFSLSRILRLCRDATVPEQLQPAQTFLFERPPFRIELNFVRDRLLLTCREASDRERELSIAGFARKAAADDWAQNCRESLIYDLPREQHLRGSHFFLTETLDCTIRTVHDLPHACGLDPIALTHREFAWLYACLMFFLWQADNILQTKG